MTSAWPAALSAHERSLDALLHLLDAPPDADPQALERAAATSTATFAELRHHLDSARAAGAAGTTGAPGAPPDPTLQARLTATLRLQAVVTSLVARHRQALATELRTLRTTRSRLRAALRTTATTPGSGGSCDVRG